MPINVSALAGFRGASSWNEDAVANLSGGGIASHGLYEGRLKAAFSKRGQDVKAANNAVRTALLTALGNAFGLEQTMGGGDRFSNEFMSRLLQLKNVVKNSAHRKAVTTVMSQQMRGFMVQNLSSGGTLPNTTHFTGLSMKSMKGGEHLLSVDNTDGTFEEGLVKERNAEVNLRIEGKKATVVVKSHGDIQLNITDAYEWHDIPMGTCNYEARFEFDLSDENEAKLTSVHLGQTIQA